MSDHIVIRIIVRFLVPFIFLFGLYIQLHGEYSPGGGFQAGVICAVAFIAYGLVCGVQEALKILPMGFIRALSALGVLLYGGVGVVAMLMGGRFLEYSVLLQDKIAGQQLGIVVIELGVGITVFAVVMIIYYSFSLRARELS